MTCTASGTSVAGQYSNLGMANATHTDVDGDTATRSDSDPSHYFGASPSLDIVKTFADDTVTAGGGASSFTLVVTNDGNVALSDVAVNDTVDARLNVTGVAVTTASVAGGETCDAPSQNVLCTIPKLAAGEPVTITVDFSVASSVSAATVSNTANANSGYTDDSQNTQTVGDTSTDTVDLKTEADLSILKDDDPDPVVAGSNLTYTMTVNNAGPSDALNVVVSDTLPAGVTLVSTAGCVEDPAGVPTCSLGTIADGASAQYAVTVTVATATPFSTIENTVVVTSDTPDPNPENNTDTEPTTIVPLGSLGDFVWLDINLNGIQDAGEPGVAGVTVNLLDGAMALLRTTTTDTNGFYLFTNLPDGNYYLQVIPPAGLGLTLQDQGTDDTKDSDFDPTTGKTGLIELTIDRSEVSPAGPAERAPVVLPPAAPVNLTFDAGLIGADVAITKTGSPAGVTVGQNVTYTVTVTNNGPTNASSVVVTDTLPAGLNLVSTTGGCSQNGAVLTCGLGTIPVGGSQSFTIVATATAVGILTNTASVTATQPDPDLTNNQASASTNVSQVAASGIIGDTVWLDSNANGIQDPGEPGIAGVTVMLTNTATGVTTIAVTNDNGKYLFSALAGGTYTVQVVLSTVPPGHTATTPTTVGVNLADGGTFNQADFGFTQVVAALPRTGADNGRIALVGLMLLLVGGLLVLSVRRGLRDEGEQAAVDS
jgi:uncharacterized repeat protein (TIGR01451 family)/LPXTG-motif cell wall-anchored protein